MLKALELREPAQHEVCMGEGGRNTTLSARGTEREKEGERERENEQGTEYENEGGTERKNERGTERERERDGERARGRDGERERGQELEPVLSPSTSSQSLNPAPYSQTLQLKPKLKPPTPPLD